MRRTLQGVLTGLLAAAAGLSAAALVAAVLRPGADPLFAVGSAAIDATPHAVKDLAVRTLGTWDKPALLLGMGLVLAAAAAGLGVLALRRPTVAAVAIGGLSLVGAVAAATRPGAAWADAVPGVVGGGVAVGVLYLLLRPAGEPAADGRPLSRRRMLTTAGLAAVAAGTAYGLRGFRADTAARRRAAVRLPAPAEPAAPPLPDLLTPNRDFYRVDTALTVPRVNPDTWRLTIKGMVDRPSTLTLDDLLRRPLIERDITMTCVSNDVGGPYVGTARWLGARLAPLLRDAGLRAGADQLIARSVDGMTIGTPIAALLDGRDAMLAVGMNGEPLPAEHGFPVRMLTPGLYGYAGSCKWVSELEVTRFADVDAYWVTRGYARVAPVKTASRIDRPAALATVPAGMFTVAGVAWAQRRGIAAVEVQVDGGPWQRATLARVPSVDTWVQWTWRWQATRGAHTLRVRATDGTGAVQEEKRVPVFPDGATGWHTLAVTVA
ncbi:molybdopterin-dependent oxidoreductase [Planosporangium mesophilum]|uniref:Oxidoreductase n=1 Tax=Planosporangium mesophilum TaxID=689768 RepID=A0A8J3WZM8_9ACTN|nr:molybdopterin-dependent oxidoreductase [Planosporangium mesophilum]NJC82984.1 molybdopterin-dependent oxidoreductase [Planosporangium mesophilum]GII22387.1 oxidoreductase [Planosporangium mesophilum]